MTQGRNFLSPFGISLIRRFEELRLKAYQDSNGFLTIGWGHRLPPGTSTDLEYTKEEADIALLKDIQWAEKVTNALHVDLSQPQFDALVCLVFNIGSGHFASSTVREKVLGGAMENAANAFMLWDDHGNAKERRAFERAVFLYGTFFG